MGKRQARELAETNRIRAARGLPPLRADMSRDQLRETLDRDELFARVRAARCWTNQVARTTQGQAQAELSAFMAIFHPEVDDQRVRAMLREVRA